jgi:2-polyprenyl-3-methyl-5-hydroxy-6-metoxy-1,4-benzoquinol methylase
MSDSRKKLINHHIANLEAALQFMKALLGGEKKPFDALLDFTETRMLIQKEEWPVAVPEESICGEDEQQKLNRAYQLVEAFLTTDLNDKKFLDFGCGEGHVPYVIASSLPITCCGYDVKNQWQGRFPEEEKNNLILTTNWDEIAKQGPFDVILVMDVLDHCKDFLKTLQKIKSVKTPQYGKIYLRLHPWTSRHGTHLYKDLNKAYLHVIFKEDELYKMGLKGMITTKITNPLEFYHENIKEAGLTILKEEIIKKPVDMFFIQHEEIERRIKRNWPKREDFPEEILEIEFVDYVLV